MKPINVEAAIELAGWKNWAGCLEYRARGVVREGQLSARFDREGTSVMAAMQDGIEAAMRMIEIKKKRT